ncbi:MAG: beta-ketoacyl-ACP synthase 3 [Firmicutes bacterium]|nr:beta-ketoacyl-ACP synthase 3 [Bacillota bacterium]
MALKIIGTGGALPRFVLDNKRLSEMVDTSDEWITTRTGIKTRRIITDETLLSLSAVAAKAALASAKIKADTLDLIICTTVLGDMISPHLSAMIQKEIGATCPAFDLNAACTGFVYGLETASAYIKAKLAKRVLLVSSEQLSNIADYTDRATCILFGDGAGAVVLEEGGNLLASRLVTKGDDSILRITRRTGNFPYDDSHNVNRCDTQRLEMNGPEVYKFAVGCLVDSIEDVLKCAKLKASDIDYFLPHQANMRIIETARIKLGIPKERILENISEFGNTSSACIPIMLDTHSRNGTFKKGDKLLIAAFGAGMSGGAAIIEW